MDFLDQIISDSKYENSSENSEENLKEELQTILELKGKEI